MDISHLHFLVAEGDPVQRRSLADMLGGLGASRITEVQDGMAALRCFEDSFTPPLDLAIIDLDLPGMDGVDLLRILGGNQTRVPVIVTGGQGRDIMFSIETLAAAFGLELLGTIAWPLTEQKLQALLENYAAPAPPVRTAGPSFTFAEVGEGLQKGQFEPFYQPKIELATGQVKGLETFARWRHPKYGVVGPGSFIDALEQNNRVDFLDWTMIELSVKGCRTLQDKGLPMPVSINLAPQTLAHPDFMEQIKACVERHHVLPDYITFEMPESSVLTNDAGFLERMVRLRMLGYGLAIDDYGTGRSNLQLLARIPFSELKIDRSFVDGASKKRPLSTVLSTCLGLARSLDRQSVAVGVETKADWDFLQGLGCTYAQGYHIAAPMDNNAFPGWLADWRLFF
ncbi:MAG TPA: EAL domain-containing response regulator [Telluria sp.]|nr:EAL domain-containing response regulator [Telluria sp.]